MFEFLGLFCVVMGALYAISLVQEFGVLAIALFILTIAFYCAGAFAILAAALATGAALLSWNRPRRLLGEIVTPEIARPYVYEGL